ncbi:MAG: hypothetical protein H7Z40_08430 [Phycisphaerae bacterium]|nr:hypothetical protein [Gemmatimonadaceae bacterium]
MPIRRFAIIALAIALLLQTGTGCERKPDATTNADSGAARPADAAIRAVKPTLRTDSGITIRMFDTTAFAATTQYVAEATPIAILDNQDVNSDTSIARVDRAVFLRDGSFVTYSRMSTHMIVFDSGAKPARILARFGTVPGDLGRNQTVARSAHDTLVVADFSNRQVNYYSSQQFVRMTPITSVVDERADQLAGVLPDGTLLLHNGGRIPEQFPNGRSKHDAILMVMNPQGLSGVIAEIPNITIATMRTGWDGERTRMPLWLRLGPQAQVIVWDSLIASGNGESYRVQFRNGGGKLVTAIEINVPPRLTPASARDADLAYRIAELEYIDGKDAVRGEKLRLRRAWPVADTIAAFSGFFVTPNNTLWITTGPAPGDSTWHATAFNSRFEMTGRLTFNGQGRPIGFGDDRVVVRSAGVDEVATLRVYRFGAK